MQWYMSTSSEDGTPPYEDPPIQDPFSSEDEEREAPDGQLLLDEPNRYVQAPTAKEAFVRVEPKDPQPAPWQIVGYVGPDYAIPETGEVPYRRPNFTAFTLNGHQIPVLDRMTDITHLLVDGLNVLDIEHFGKYGWSDWWILPAITIIESFNFRNKPWGPRRFSQPKPSSSSESGFGLNLETVEVRPAIK